MDFLLFSILHFEHLLLLTLAMKERDRHEGQVHYLLSLSLFHKLMHTHTHTHTQ